MWTTSGARTCSSITKLSEASRRDGHQDARGSKKREQCCYISVDWITPTGKKPDHERGHGRSHRLAHGDLDLMKASVNDLREKRQAYSAGRFGRGWQNAATGRTRTLRWASPMGLGALRASRRRPRMMGRHGLRGSVGADAGVPFCAGSSAPPHSRGAQRVAAVLQEASTVEYFHRLRHAAQADLPGPLDAALRLRSTVILRS